MTKVHASTETGSASAAGDPKQKVQKAAAQAQEKAQQAAGPAKNRLAVEVNQRSSEAGERLRSTAGDVRSVGDELRKQGKDKPAQLAERAADRVERIGGYLHESDGDRILRDVEDFGRRNPWAVAAGGLALGFVASRFLKASSGRRYQAADSCESRANVADSPLAGPSYQTDVRPPVERPLTTPPTPAEPVRPEAR